MNILNEIIALDKTAAKRAEEEINAEKKRSAEYGSAMAKSRTEKVEIEREKTMKLRSEQEKNLSEKLSGAEKEKSLRQKQLSDIFEKNRAQWKSEIISRITEG